MTITKRQAMRSLEVAGAIMTAKRVRFTQRDYLRFKTAELHSWDAMRRALGDPRTGVWASTRTLRVYAGHPVEVGERRWEDHLEEMVWDLGPVSMRFYDENREKGSPTSRTLKSWAGLSWPEMISVLDDEDE